MRQFRRFRTLFLFLLVCLLFGAKFNSFAQVAPPQTNITYAQRGDQALQLDVYGADTAQKKPALIFLHGGGWVGGSRKDMAFAAANLAPRGYVCFTVSYRLVKGDQNRYPAQIDDVQRAVRWIRAHADDYGVNPDKIGVLGASAGGHLAALLGTMDTRDNSDPELAKYSSRVECVVDLYGPSDLTPALDPQNQELATPEQKALIGGFLGPLPENADNYREASPVTHIDAKSAPFLIFHGAKDTLVPLAQSQLLDEKLKAAGVESRLVVFPNAGHAYSDPDLLIQTFTQAIAFFDAHLKN